MVSVEGFLRGVVTSAELPEIPEGNYLEDYVAAYLQCGGFYTEKSIVERGETEMLELDIVAWRPSDALPEHTLVEIKGGGWGFSDIFKILGWKTYLQSKNVDSAYLVAPSGGRRPEEVDYTRDKSLEMGINLLTFDDLNTLESNLIKSDLLSEAPSDLDLAIWRFSFWLERQMQRVVRTERRSRQQFTGPSEVYSYQEQIRNGLVQARDVRERLGNLYDAHFKHQRLAKAVASELDGGSWNPSDPADSTYWTEAMYKCQHPLVQAAMYYEHRAKLGILKGAVEYALLKKYNSLPPRRTIRILGALVPADFLPMSFLATVDAVLQIERFESIPVLWQSFLWKWGGFFISDLENDEKSALAGEVGMTVEAVNSSMALYDVLFPLEGGWFHESQGTKALKLFPCEFKGIGAYYRRTRLNEDDFSETFGKMGYTYLESDLVRWNNSTVSLLNYGSTS